MSLCAYVCGQFATPRTARGDRRIFACFFSCAWGPPWATCARSSALTHSVQILRFVPTTGRLFGPPRGATHALRPRLGPIARGPPRSSSMTERCTRFSFFVANEGRPKFVAIAFLSTAKRTCTQNARCIVRAPETCAPNWPFTQFAVSHLKGEPGSAKVCERLGRAHTLRAHFARTTQNAQPLRNLRNANFAPSPRKALGAPGAFLPPSLPPLFGPPLLELYI